MADKLYARTQVPGGKPNAAWQEIPEVLLDSNMKEYIDAQIQNLKKEIEQAKFLSVGD